jgi:hypothetical protein
LGYSADVYGITHVGTELTGTSGATAKLALTGEYTNLYISVDDAGSDPVYFKIRRNGASAPTVSAATYNAVVNPGEERLFPWSHDLDVYAFGTGAAYTVLPVGF